MFTSGDLECVAVFDRISVVYDISKWWCRGEEAPHIPHLGLGEGSR